MMPFSVLAAVTKSYDSIDKAFESGELTAGGTFIVGDDIYAYYGDSTDA